MKDPDDLEELKLVTCRKYLSILDKAHKSFKS